MRLVGLNFQDIGVVFFSCDYQTPNRGFFLVMGMKVRLQKERKINEKGIC